MSKLTIKKSAGAAPLRLEGMPSEEFFLARAALYKRCAVVWLEKNVQRGQEHSALVLICKYLLILVYGCIPVILQDTPSHL